MNRVYSEGGTVTRVEIDDPAEIIDTLSTPGYRYRYRALPGSNPADPVWYGVRETIEAAGVPNRIMHDSLNPHAIADNRTTATFV